MSELLSEFLYGMSSTKRRGTDWTAAYLEGSTAIFSVRDAATFAPAELKKAACVALLVWPSIQEWSPKDNDTKNKDAYTRLGENSCELIAAIWRSFMHAENPNEWLAEMREVLEDLTRTLELIRSSVQEQSSREMFRKVGCVERNQRHAHLTDAIQKLEVRYQLIDTNHILSQIRGRTDQLTKPIINWKGVYFFRDQKKTRLPTVLKWMKEVELDRQLEEEANRLKREEEEEIAQLKRTIAAAEEDRRSKSARKQKSSGLDFWVEEATSKEERERKRRSAWHVWATLPEEEERSAKRISKAKPAVFHSAFTSPAMAIDVDCGYTYLPPLHDDFWPRPPAAPVSRAHVSTQSRSESGSAGYGYEQQQQADTYSTQQGDEQMDYAPSHPWYSNPCYYHQPPATDSAPVTLRLRPAKRRPVALEDTTDEDDDFQHLKTRTARRRLSSTSLREGDSQYSKIRMTHRNLSSVSLRAQKTEEDDTDEEDEDAPPPPRKSPQLKRKPPTFPDNLPRDGEFQGFTPTGLANPQWGGLGSPLHMPGIPSNTFIPSSPSIPYGYGAGIPGTACNSNVGNITNTTIENVGNDNSVKNVWVEIRLFTIAVLWAFLSRLFSFL